MKLITEKSAISVLAISVLLFLLSCGNGSQRDNADETGSETVEAAADDQEATSSNRGPVFNIKKTSHDFGEVPLGERVQTRFPFKNTGDEPLIIHNASAGCGCTIPDYSADPVEPGEEGFIDVEYNSANRPLQRFQQSVSIRANTDPSTVHLRVTGEVVEPESAASTDHKEAQVQAEKDQDRVVNPDAPRFQFRETDFDFGEVENNTKVTHRFRFVNTGNSPLIIDDIRSGCGCTVPEYTDEPVNPGEEGYVDVTYDTGARDVTDFHQRVTIFANTDPGINYLSVRGTIKE